MRNLKKILALVLALVMSLSLMATAGASSFPDVDAENPYATAIEVLDELKVFQGYKEDGTFRPTETLNRAQAAVLVYRIATGDVEDKYLDNYTYMQQSKFTDLDGYNWAKGYINYCQNAGIVVGTSSTTFDPGAKVTGYQLLVMLLRTLGYGKAGEFADPKGWELQTATIAERENITKNVTAGDFGAPAPRQMVAEILFRGLLTETVEYSALIAGGYTKSGETLGKRELGLEEVSGIVTGNEYADLDSSSTLPGGKTDLLVGEKEYRLNVTTDLTAIGESRTAYVKKGTQNSFNLVVDKLFGNDNNVRAESGDATSVSALADTQNLSLSGAEYFVNFEEAGRWESDYKIKYVLKFTPDADGLKKAEAKAAEINWYGDYKSTDSKYVVVKDVKDTANPTNTLYYVVERTIPRTEEIYSCDISNMMMIFGEADKTDDSVTDSFVTGEIYVGTQSTKDISDDPDYSWTIFEEKFLEFTENIQNFSKSGNGEWLKVIDNDGDGIAEYVFGTWYALAEITGYNSRKEYYTYSAPGKGHDNYGWEIDLSEDAVNYVGDYEPAVGDLVLAAPIDGKWQIEKAPMETKTIKTVSFRDKTVTTTEDDVYDESVISNWTEYADDMLAMSDEAKYEIFFDHFGHVIAYREVQGQTKYALLSELYYTNEFNGKYIKNNTPIVEITMGEEDTVEMLVSNAKDNVFDGAGRTYFNNKGVSFTDYLTRAISQLGITNTSNLYLQDTAEWTTPTTLDEKNQYVYDYDANGDPVNPSATHKVTETNVAAYTLDEDGEKVAVNSVSDPKTNRSGDVLYYTNLNENGGIVADASINEKVTYEEYKARLDKAAPADSASAYIKPVFATDYVKLDATKDVKKGAVRFDIDKLDVSYNVYNQVPVSARPNWDGNYVNATHNTEFYIVGVEAKTGNTTATVVTGIEYFTDYANVPEIDGDDITAIYAVARNTNADVGKRDYWVADVIVIETKDVVQPYDSMSLIYNNPSKTSGQVRDLEALDSQTKDPSVTLIPKDKKSWPGQWSALNDYGFYELYETEVNEPSITAGRIEGKLTAGYNAHGIFAATVTRDVRVQAEGDYVMVHKGDNNNAAATDTTEFKLATGEVPVYAVWSDDWNRNYPTWELVPGLTMKSIEAGDEIIYVKDKGGNVKYIVIANYGGLGTDANHGHIDDHDWADGWHQADWLSAEWDRIIAEQNKAPATDAVNLHFILGTGESAVVTYGTQTFTATAANPTGTLNIPENAALFTFDVQLPATVSIHAGYALSTDWTVVSAVLKAGTTNTYTVRVLRNDVQVAALALPAAGTDVVIATAAGWTDFMKEVNTAIKNPATTKEELAAISENLTAADKAIVNAFTTLEQAAIDKALEDIGAIGAPSESFGTIKVKDSAPAGVISVQHTAGSATVYLNIKGDVPAALQMTVEQLLGYLTTDADEAINFVSCTQKANGTAGDKTMYASAMDKIIVKVGTCETLVTINVTTENTAPTFRTVTWADTTNITVTVKDPGTQAGIKAGDVVKSGDKFLDGVVLEVAFDKDWNTDIAATSGTLGAAADGKNTLTIGTGDATLTLTAKDTITITAPAGVAITSLNKVEGGAIKALKDAAVTFTVADADKYTLAVSNTDGTITPTLADGVYSISAGDAGKDITIALTEKSADALKVEAAAAVINGLTLALEKTTAATEGDVKSAVVAQVNKALADAKITGLDIADTAVEVKASDNSAAYTAPAQDGASVTAKVTITLAKDATDETELGAKDMVVTWKSAGYKAKEDAKAAIEAVMPEEVNQADYNPATLLAHLKELAESVTVEGVTISDVVVAKTVGDDFISGKTWTFTVNYKVAVGNGAAEAGTQITVNVFIR